MTQSHKHSLALIIGIILALSSCGNFYPSFTDHGVPKNSKDTIRDTITIPADSLVLTPLFALNDTLWSSEDSLRANTTAVLKWTTEIPTDIDSAILYGVIRSLDTLNLEYYTELNPFATPLIVEIKPSQDSVSLDHSFSLTITQSQVFKIHASVAKTIQTPYSLHARILLGYESEMDHYQTLSSNISLTEVLRISEYYSLSIPPQTHFWDSVQIKKNDSLVGILEGDSLQTSVLEASQITRFQRDGVIQDALWSNANSPDTLKQYFTGDEGIIYILYSNPTDTLRRLNAIVERTKPLTRF